jgi:hypothetical protein
MLPGSIARRSTAAAVILLLTGAAPACAATVHAAGPLVSASILGGIFHSIGHALLGAFSWTFGLAAKFVLVTLGAIARLLIPRSWASEGVHIMQWIVAVPDYAGTIATPAGGHVYGFAGVNDLRDLFLWIGAAILPLTLVYATSRAMIGAGDPVAVPILRVIVLGALLLFYPYWWGQLAAAVNQVTNMVLTLTPVVGGLHKLMLYAVEGIGLGGWQLVDLGLMIALGLELLGLIFVKVVIILAGALLYATGPLMIGLAPTRAGETMTRAWASAAAALLALPVLWAAVFAVGALLINDAGTAGPLVGGQSDIGQLLGGLLVALAGLASLWACLKLAREAGGLLRIQLGAMLAAAHQVGTRSSTATPAASGGRPADSIRSFANRVSSASGAATQTLAASGTGGSVAVAAGRRVASVGRRGVIGTAAAGVRSGAAYAAAPAGALVGRSRAGAVASQMARTGKADWHKTQGRSSSPSTAPRTPKGSRTEPGTGQTARPATPPASGRSADRSAAAQTVPRPGSAKPAGGGQSTSSSRPPGSRTPAPSPAPVSPPSPPATGASEGRGSAGRRPSRPSLPKPKRKKR